MSDQTTDKSSDQSTDAEADVVDVEPLSEDSLETIPDLSPNALKALRSAGVRGIEDLTRFTPKSLKAIPGVGDASVRAITAHLEGIGRPLGGALLPQFQSDDSDAAVVVEVVEEQDRETISGPGVDYVDAETEVDAPVLGKTEHVAEVLQDADSIDPFASGAKIREMLLAAAPQPDPDPSNRGDIPTMARKIAAYEHGSKLVMAYCVGRFVVEELFGGDIEQAGKRGPKRESISALNEALGRERTSRTLRDQVKVYVTLERLQFRDFAVTQKLAPTHVIEVARHPDPKAHKRLLLRLETGDETTDSIRAKVKKAKAKTKGESVRDPKGPSLARLLEKLTRQVTDATDALTDADDAVIDPATVRSARGALLRLLEALPKS